MIYNSEVEEYSIKEFVGKEEYKGLVIHGNAYLKTSVNITKKQRTFLEDNSLNLSSLIRNTIDTMMRKVKMV